MHDGKVKEEFACLGLANIEEATAARALAAESAQLATREPHVAGDEQDGGSQAQQLLLPAQLVGVSDGHPGGGRPAQVLLRLLHLALKAVNAADVKEKLVLAAAPGLPLLCPRCLEPIRIHLPARYKAQESTSVVNISNRACSTNPLTEPAGEWILAGSWQCDDAGVRRGGGALGSRAHEHLCGGLVCDLNFVNQPARQQLCLEVLEADLLSIRTA